MSNIFINFVIKMKNSVICYRVKQIWRIYTLIPVITFKN